MHLYSALLRIAVHPKHLQSCGGGGGVSPQPPPVCSIHLDDLESLTVFLLEGSIAVKVFVYY